MSESIAAIQRWGESGRQLENAVQAYLSSCKALDIPTFSYPSGTRHLISMIDDRLYSFDNLLTDRLSSARVSLAHTRNKLAASILRLPVEIVSRIFSLAIDINIASIDEAHECSADFVTKIRYHTLHNLLGVCRDWRRIGMSHGALWSLVPVIRHRDGRLTSLAAQLSFERAGSRLHVVADFPGAFSRCDISIFMEDALARHGLRINSINFRTAFEGHLTSSLSGLIRATSEAPGSLHELSLCFYRRSISHERHTSNRCSLEPCFPEYTGFIRMLESLRVLKLCQVWLPFRDLSLRSLTKLRLQRLAFGSRAELEVFFRALSSSSQLRDLEIISVLAAVDRLRVLLPPPSDFQISLPALDRLYLEDLYPDILNAVLASITPGGHGVTLNLTSNSYSTPFEADPLNILKLVLEGLSFQVDTLMMGCEPADVSFHGILKLMPRVTSLYMDSWTMHDSRYLLDLISPADPNSDFPELTKLHISRTTIPLSGLDDLRNAVASHPIEELGIGVVITEIGETEDLQQPLEELDPIRSWLLDTVPRVVWLPSIKYSKPSMPEFASGVWVL
ncbi:unnamed protein product [Rhizoctonia solani]|uniref:F-box domain-containing protein n=1 Tax=Rhizoctonia solani TaxID=456999 RepID=A0A8H3BX18_9AGAM|nr:unnamed protein product [Rhizoctonia solani]